MGRREAHYSLPSLAGGYRGVGNPLKNFAPLRYFIKGLQIGALARKAQVFRLGI